jgi:hypothetical protein
MNPVEMKSRMAEIERMITCRTTSRPKRSRMRQCSIIVRKKARQNKHLVANSLLVNSTTISSKLALGRWICKKDRCTISHHFSQNRPVFTNKHIGWHTLPPGIALFVVRVSSASPLRKTMRRQPDVPATPKKIFDRPWR